MNLGTGFLFFILAGISAALIVYSILLGMAPGVKPLDWTGVFIYSPGPGFFILVGWLLLTSGIQISAWLAKFNHLSGVSQLCHQISWIALGLLLILQLFVIYDFKS